MMICHSDEFFSEWWPTVTALNFKELWEEKRNYQSQNHLASTSAI